MRWSFPLIICVVLFLAACTPQQQACTEEAKLCPDGSTVGRTGPNCTFAPCPQGVESDAPTSNPQTEGVVQKQEVVKQYIGKTLEECARIRYFCEAGQDAFQDERGCGCRYTETHFVITTHAVGDSCTLEYNPVCGYTAAGRQTFGNSCQALQNSKVTYYVLGACPDPEPSAPAENTDTPVVPATHDLPVAGTCDLNNKPTNCAKTSDPVCGDDGKNYMNPCAACSSGKVTEYGAGKCVVNSVPFLATRCTSDIAQQDCSQGYHDQVCAYFTDGGKRTFENKCLECQDTSVFYYYGGACAGDPVTSQKVTKVKQSCGLTQPDPCPDTDEPVCGYREESSYTYENSCVACTLGVQFYYDAACA